MVKHSLLHLQKYELFSYFLIQGKLKMQIQQDFSLRTLNTFGIDARAHFYTELNTVDEICSFALKDYNTYPELLILGGGSNVLFTRHFHGMVARISVKGIREISLDDSHVFLSVMAGEIWDDVVQYSVLHGYSGLENLSLIPGTAGAAPIQNIGAYGVEAGDCIHSVKTVELGSGDLIEFPRDICAFGYRDSFFKNAGKGKYIITEVIFRLSLRPALRLDYGAIRQQLLSSGIQPENVSPSALRQAVIDIRRSKLPDPQEIGNAGSFFKNPVIKISQFRELQQTFPDIVSYPVDDQHVKLAAGWMIEQCGWKGYRKGDAGIHERQALVLVNYGLATGEEILELARAVQQSVKETFDVLIHPEVNLI